MADLGHPGAATPSERSAVRGHIQATRHRVTTRNDHNQP
jgi:hypothetical protein